MGNVLYRRAVTSDGMYPNWERITSYLTTLTIDKEGKIEDSSGHLQADFANKEVGGGVLARGCLQEEIRFVICPELIAARFFTDALQMHEALIITGAERFSRYSGYGDTFRFEGNYNDLTEIDDDYTLKVRVVAIDALNLNDSSGNDQYQYEKNQIFRELNKVS